MFMDDMNDHDARHALDKNSYTHGMRKRLCETDAEREARTRKRAAASRNSFNAAVKRGDALPLHVGAH